MAQRISFDITLQLDKIITTWIEQNIVVEDALACDKDGNKVKGFSLRSSRLPRSILVSNDIEISYKEISDKWTIYTRTFNLPNSGVSMTQEDNCISFSGDTYSKSQFDLVCWHIQMFLHDIFNKSFDLNS